MRGRNDQYAAVTQPVSGASTPSRPCSTASEDSVPPGCHYTHTNVPQQPHGAPPHEGQHSSPGDPARLPQSKSLPLLDDFDGLTELQQQVADMMAHVGLLLLCNHTACVVQCMEVLQFAAHQLHAACDQHTLLHVQVEGLTMQHNVELQNSALFPSHLPTARISCTQSRHVSPGQPDRDCSCNKAANLRREVMEIFGTPCSMMRWLPKTLQLHYRVWI